MASFSNLRPSKPYEPFLLAADIDGTLIGDQEGENWLRLLVKNFPGCFYLAMVTGRAVPKVVELLKDGRLPPPDYVCGAVGTELFDCNDPKNNLGQKYAARVPPGWDLETVYALGAGEGVQPQEFPEGRPRFQAGFDWDGRPESLAAFRDRYRDQTGYTLLESYGKYIDVFPATLGKGNFVRFIQEALDLDSARVVVAGDTGNDRQMFDLAFKGIVPANALDELKSAACQPWHYHSPFPAGRGVLDGLRYFGFLEQDTTS